MDLFAGWHLAVLALIVVVPILVVGAIVLIAVRVGRSSRALEERIAQRTAELLRTPDHGGV